MTDKHEMPKPDPKADERQDAEVIPAGGGKVTAARPATMRKMVAAGGRPLMQRRAVLTREMVETGPRVRWVESGSDGEVFGSGLILKLEERLFGSFEASESAWKRTAGATDDKREWPLPPARERGELRGRPEPAARPVTPPLRRR